MADPAASYSHALSVNAYGTGLSVIADPAVTYNQVLNVTDSATNFLGVGNSIIPSNQILNIGASSSTILLADHSYTSGGVLNDGIKSPDALQVQNRAMAFGPYMSDGYVTSISWNGGSQIFAVPGVDNGMIAISASQISNSVVPFGRILNDGIYAVTASPSVNLFASPNPPAYSFTNAPSVIGVTLTSVNQASNGSSCTISTSMIGNTSVSLNPTINSGVTTTAIALPLGGLNKGLDCGNGLNP